MACATPCNGQSTHRARARRRDPRHRDGVMMLEVMIALVILGVGILGATAGQIAAIKLSSDSRLSSEAMHLAERQLETFTAMPAADLLALPGVGVDPGNPIDPDVNDGTRMALNRSWVIAADTVEAGMITITVNVAWTNALGNISTTSVQSLKANL
jgi:type IV pilus assembly protein PilV